ncbi:unnamed protein product [Soboliphyme baturini]|uniref:Uncharacterized protein n=1 Tax=Soboliphyme baturini TaxID=241478 RepID=A0A183IAQ6_9BILA|nr:unnamed protein product [Soboliphyme baturini]
MPKVKTFRSRRPALSTKPKPKCQASTRRDSLRMAPVRRGV